MPLPMPLEPPTTSTCLPLKSSSFIPRSFFLFARRSYAFDLSADRCQPCQSCSVTQHFCWAHFPRAITKGHCMSEFKQLSRSVKGLTVLVTGAASGMGRATARVFAAEGANVAVTDIGLEPTQAVVDAITATGGSAKAWKLDVADRNDITT